MAQKYKLNPKTGLYSTLVWDGTYTATGRKHRKQITSKKSSADLEKKVYEFKKQIDKQIEQNGTANAPKYTFGQYAERWFTMTKVSLADHTKTSYRQSMRYLQPIYHIPITDIKLYDIQCIINDNISKPPTCKAISSTFDQIIKYAVRERVIPTEKQIELCGSAILPKCKKKQKRPLYPHEKEAIFKADFEESDRIFIMILYYCGVRKSEALALTNKDFDFSNNTVSINKNLTIQTSSVKVKESPKSDNGFRTIPLPDCAVGIIKPYVEKKKGNLFTTPTGGLCTFSYYAVMWRRIIKAMNEVSTEPIEGLTAHIFRHNYCTELCYKVPKVSTKMIARLLGDKEDMVLNVYSHIMEEKEDPCAVINEIFL